MAYMNGKEVIFYPRTSPLQGVGISNIEKTATEGNVDTYTITLTDGETYTFTVTNGVLTNEQTTELNKLSAWYDESHYVDMTGTFTATNGGGTAEIGGEITSTFGWKFSKLPTSLTVGGVAQAKPTQEGTTEEQTFTASSQTSKTFTITGVYAGAYGDEKVSKTWTYYFQNKRYCGYAAEPTTLDGSFIKSLTGEFATSRVKTFNLNKNEKGKYIWYAYPTRFGLASFSVGGYAGCFEEPDTISVTNGAGFTEDYYLYRSTNVGVGDLEVIVK